MLAEAEVATELCEEALAETRASLVQTENQLRVARQTSAESLADRPVPSPISLAVQVAGPNPAAVPMPQASPHVDDAGRKIAMSRHRAVQRSLDKVLAGVRDCQDELGGGEMTQLRTRVRIDPDGQASAVEIAGKSDSTLAKCVTAAIRVRHYAKGEQAEWVRHAFTFESDKEAP